MRGSGMCLRLRRGQDSLDLGGFAFFPKETRFHQVEALELNPTWTQAEATEMQGQAKDHGQEISGVEGGAGERAQEALAFIHRHGELRESLSWELT